MTFPRAIGVCTLAVLAVCEQGCAQATTQPEAAAPAQPAAPLRPVGPDGFVQGPPRAGWWNDRVFYEVFVRSFKDHDGDGIGDIPGLIGKLDSLNDGDAKTTTDLGVTGLWLMPINPSPSYHGYDVTDYYGINPRYGTLDDFRRLVQECHKRGIAVILDLVLNHCSSRHPWFLEAADPESPKHDWFIWSDADPGWKGPWGQTVWHRSTLAKNRRWYYGLFSPAMPDLNYRTPAVGEEMLRVADFWIDPGHGINADGYRLDAIRHLVEDGRVQENTPETHAWLKRFHARCRAANPRAMSIGEVWTSSEIASTYVGDQLDMTFEFDLASAMVETARTGLARPVIEAQARVLRCYPPNQYGRFLTNHDQTRVLTQLRGDAGAMRTAAALLLLGPGVPFVYYGEEIGMTGDKPDEHLRRPMRWDDSAGAGFTSGTPWQGLGPDAPSVNVRSEASDRGSLLWYYRKLIGLRAEYPAIASGAMVPVVCSDPAVYAFVRTGERPVLVVINAGDAPATDFTLACAGSPLREKYLPWDVAREPIEGECRGAMLDFGADGAFRDYRPMKTLAPHGASVFVLGRPR